ncbi:MAG: ThuA domain-containing protein [Deinococcota bacterium]
MQPTSSLNVTVWNEFRHEQQEERIAKIYPQGIHAVIAESLAPHVKVRTATLDEPEHGLTDDVLDSTDVLVWWGHIAHGDVSDAVVNKVHARVLAGMGMVVLHSGHFSKIFKKLMGTTCDLKWRNTGEKERLWVVDPSHPIAEGLDEYFELPKAEMYGEHFDIPEPDKLVFVSWFAGGEVFRSGCCFHRGRGKIFYFRPGDEAYPIYKDHNVQRVIHNGVVWAAPTSSPVVTFGHRPEPLEPLS